MAPRRAPAKKAGEKERPKVYDYSGLEKGTKLQIESEGSWFAGEVVQVSDSKSRAKAPVKVTYKGYTGYDEWVGGDRLKSKAIKAKAQEDARKGRASGDYVPPPPTSAGDFPVDGSGRFVVDFSMHGEQRARLCERLKLEGRVRDAGKAMVYLEGGKESARSNTDAEDLFRQESFFFYLTGVKEPDCQLLIDVASGKATLFIPRPNEAWITVMGPQPPPEGWQDMYKIEKVMYNDSFDDFLAGEKPTLMLLLSGKNTDSMEVMAPPALPKAKDSISSCEWDSASLYNALTECRLRKTQKEVQLLQWLNDLSSDAHLACMRYSRPGLKEYQYEPIFQHWTYFRGGARICAYTPIAATGSNCAVLHYGHAGAPNDRLCVDGDLALLDMGAEFHCYASDITNSFPVKGKFTADQRIVFEAVADAQKKVMEQMRPGCDWKRMQELSYEVILTHLTKAGLLTGKLEDMMAVNLGSVFMPHGLGHLMGLETHDVGGFPDNDDSGRDQRPGFRSLRNVRPLEEGMVITVEPGCYFVDFLLDRALEDEATKGFLVPSVLQRFRGRGGVRLEDNVLVTASGAASMTSCPRTVAEMEKVIRGKITDKRKLTRVLPRAA